MNYSMHQEALGDFRDAREQAGTSLWSMRHSFDDYQIFGCRNLHG